MVASVQAKLRVMKLQRPSAYHSVFHAPLVKEHNVCHGQLDSLRSALSPEVVAHPPGHESHAALIEVCEDPPAPVRHL